MAEAQPLFDLVVLGHNSKKSAEALVRDVLSILGEHSPTLEFKLADALISKQGLVAIRDAIPFEEAHLLAEKLVQLQIDCDIRPAMQVVSAKIKSARENEGLYTCPACNHQQERLLDCCEACGVIGEEFLKQQRLQEVIEFERQNQESDRAKRIRTVLERAKQEEETILREEARRRLENKTQREEHSLVKITSLLTVLTLVAGGGYYLTQLAPTPTEIAGTALVEEGAAGSKGPKLVEEETRATEAELVAETAQVEPVKGVNVAKAITMAAITTTQPDISDTGQKLKQTELPLQQRLSWNKAIVMEALMLDALRVQRTKAVVHQQQKRLLARIWKEIQATHLGFTRFSVSGAQYALAQQQVQQLLAQEAFTQLNHLLSTFAEPYMRTLLRLELMVWQLENTEPKSSIQASFQKIQQELKQTQTPRQQALVLGVIAQAYLLQTQWNAAGDSLLQATDKALLLPSPSEQVILLSRLAIEQIFFGHKEIAKRILEEASLLANALPGGEVSRSDSFTQLVFAYALLADFEAANQHLKQIDGSVKRRKLTEFLDNLQAQIDNLHHP